MNIIQRWEINQLMNYLKKLTKIIYLETPKSSLEEMVKKYIDDPKPVIWGNTFEAKEGEKI